MNPRLKFASRFPWRRLLDEPALMSPWAGLLGVVLGFGAGWAALQAGLAAAVLLALLLVGGLVALRRRIHLVSGRWPIQVGLPPAPAGIAPPDPDPLIDVVALVGGRFLMGSPASDPLAYPDERPRHEVTLSPFLVGRSAVTRGLWRRVMAGAPAPWRREVPGEWGRGDDDVPATDVDWFDALAFCNALSVLSDRRPCYRQKEDDDWGCDWSADGYRLPTEAEWEYACRGGRRTPWHWGRWSIFARRYAWYSSNAKGRVQPVARKRPNGFDLYDMAGNCWEWCWDRFGDCDRSPVTDPRGPADGRLRVLRGGSFAAEPWVLRSAGRVRNRPVGRFVDFGFRCVRSGAPASRFLAPSNPWNPRTWLRRLRRRIRDLGPWMARRG